MVVWKTGVFGAVHWRRCGFRLTFDSPSATRADREARPLSLGGHGRGTARFQGFGNRIVETFEPDELQLLRRALRNLIEVPPVTRAGSITLVRPAAAAATTFSLMPPTGSQTPQRYLASHRCITSNRAIGKQGGKRPEHRNAGARSVLWGGARGHMNVDVAVLRLPHTVNQARMRMSSASLARMWWRPLYAFAP